MAERRSLAAAVSTPVPGVDHELVRSFVTQNQHSERPIVAPARISDEPRPVVRDEIARIDSVESRTPKAKSKKANRFQPVGLIPVTIRLRPDIAGALKRASLERELEGEEVFTQQDIVEQALEPWLKREGMLP
ncbi:MAG: hypothetical protein SGI77_04485 [Pirellulaceae bacterium]|nr:hypothetical protein [Pirellulaceae bacterium]